LFKKIKIAENLVSAVCTALLGVWEFKRLGKDAFLHLGQFGIISALPSHNFDCDIIAGGALYQIVDRLD